MIRLKVNKEMNKNDVICIALSRNGFYSQKSRSKICVISHVSVGSEVKIGDILVSLRSVRCTDIMNEEITRILCDEDIVNNYEVCELYIPLYL
jgi:hypothetical protein